MLSLRRTPSFSTRPTSTPVSRKSHNGSSAKIAHQLPEMLEFEWPDLPPIDLIKDALTRNTVSRGIMYILPVDKSKASVENKYRTDLRAQFQEPYVDATRNFRESELVQSTKLHFRHGVSTQRAARWEGDAPVDINADSEKCRQLYLRSAPSGERLKSPGFLEQGKRRSHLILPIKTPIPPEAVRMRKEAEKILQSVRDEEADYAISDGMKKADDTSKHKSSRENQRDVDRKRVEEIIKLKVAQRRSLEKHEEDTKVFTSYSDIKGAKAPKPLVPATVRSDFLTLEQNQEIWNWLHHGEQLSDFEYFLSVCG